MKNLTIDEWKSQLLSDSNAIVLDVRTTDEIEEGVIPNAIHADVKQPQLFLDTVNALDKTKNYYVYCQSGARSLEACAVLNLLCNITEAYSLTGGFSVWDGEVEVVSILN